MSERDKDFSILVKLLNSFLSDVEVKKRLHSIVRSKTNDWEKWFQIEFEFFVNSKKKYFVKREVTALLDKSIFPESTLSKIDMVIKEKKSNLDEFIFLEIKCTKKTAALKRGIKNDQNKLNAIMECEYNKKSSFCVGFHLDCLEKSTDDMKKYTAEMLNGSYAVFKICGCPGNRKCSCEYNEIGVVLC